MNPKYECTIKKEEVSLIEKVGMGRFGSVYSALCRGQKIAVKVIADQETTLFTQELRILTSIHHPNVCQFLGVFKSDSTYKLCLEFIDYNLSDYLLKMGKTFSLLKKMRMARDAARGVNYLHTLRPRIIHRDLKTENLMITRNDVVKVCDFGLSQTLTKRKPFVTGFRGSFLWQAPEVMVPGESRADEKSDVYSFGLIMWQILTQRPIFDNLPDDCDKNDFEDYINSGKRMEIPSGTPLSISYLINQCWASNPDDRPTFGEVVNSIYNIILEVSISDPQARDWWRSNFLTSSGLEEEVPWKDFQAKVVATLAAEGKGALCASYGEKMWKSFHAILSQEWNREKTYDKIRIEEFGSVVGNLDGFAAGFDHMITTAHTLTGSLWFTGWNDISEGPAASFYVRFSKSGYGYFTACFFLGDDVKKKIMLRRDERNAIVFEQVGFSSLVEVVGEIEKMGYNPCPTFSPYKWISCESAYI